MFVIPKHFKIPLRAKLYWKWRFFCTFIISAWHVVDKNQSNGLSKLAKVNTCILQFCCVIQSGQRIVVSPP